MRYRHVGPDRRDEFVARGLPARHFFPHSVYVIPKYGPDAIKLAQRMIGGGGAQHYELLLHAQGPLLDAFPPSLFADDEVVWHRQQFGLPGHVAYACLVVRDGALYGLNYVSDLAQRMSRRRELKTRVENAFGGWHHLLLNAVVAFAGERGCTRVYSPSAALVMSQTDRSRHVKPELFERVYDRAVGRFVPVRSGGWWTIDVAANLERIVPPTLVEGPPPPRDKTVCVVHDIERGLGHRDTDPGRAARADRMAARVLDEMLECEMDAGVAATYTIVGQLYDEVRRPIEKNGHCLAFHSYSHRVRPWWPISRHYYRARRALTPQRAAKDHEDQLYSCRLVDPRVRGFRPPRSRPSPEWTDRRLSYRNFEWLATSRARLGVSEPFLCDGLVKIPIHLDDYPLYRGMPFAAWRHDLLTRIARSPFVVVGLHDCYGDLWLEPYRELLARIQELGDLRTLDQIADRVFLAHSV